MSAERPAERRCECGCGGSLGGYSARRRFLPNHRQRDYRRRVRERMEAVGLPANPSLSVARASNLTRERNGDAQRGSRAPRRRFGGATVSYRRALAEVERELAALGAADAAGAAAAALDRALSPANRLRVEASASCRSDA